MLTLALCCTALWKQPPRKLSSNHICDTPRACRSAILNVQHHHRKQLRWAVHADSRSLTHNWSARWLEGRASTREHFNQSDYGEMRSVFLATPWQSSGHSLNSVSLAIMCRPILLCGWVDFINREEIKVVVSAGPKGMAGTVLNPVRSSVRPFVRPCVRLRMARH